MKNEIIISHDNLKSNIRKIRGQIGVNTKIISVIKANAYGHGLIEIAKTLEKLKITYFAVTSPEEAIELRKNGINTNILVLEPLKVETIKALSNNDITQTVSSIEEANYLLSGKLEKKIKIHIKINTGMNRFGFNGNKEDISTIKKLVNRDNLCVEGIYTHFLDSTNRKITQQQFQKFTRIIKRIEHNFKFKIKHCANSGAVINFPEMCLDAVRIGMLQFGSSDWGINLKPVMTVKSHIISTRSIRKGETIGYGAKFTAIKDIRMAVVNLGYSDGYNRALSNNGYVLVKGIKCNIIGNICMDFFFIDISDLVNIKIGEEVLVVGVNGEYQIFADDLLKKSGVISYELFTNINRKN